MFKARGDAAEERAQSWLQQRGLTLVQRNYRVARGPNARGGEIDLVMRDADGTLVFVAVRARQHQPRRGCGQRHFGQAAQPGAGGTAFLEPIRQPAGLSL